MITFAVLYFCLMVEAGLFDPAVARILRWAKGDPMRITVGTAVLTLLVALDGDGASTFLITVSACCRSTAGSACARWCSPGWSASARA